MRQNRLTRALDGAVSRWVAAYHASLQWVLRHERLTLADRTFRCGRRGLVLDRDPDAAINLAKLAGSAPERQNACGGESAGQGLAALVDLSPPKQEPDTRYPAG